MSRLPSDRSFGTELLPSGSRNDAGLAARVRRLIGAGAVGAGVFALVLGSAYAQDAKPRPVIDSAPRKVAFGKAVVIRGHLDHGTDGDRVSLQRSTSGVWRDVRTAAVDDDLRVRFRIKGMRKSSGYRLVYAGGSSDAPAADSATRPRSDGIRVRVKPRLTLQVRPARVMAGQVVRVNGVLRPHEPGRRVTVKRRTTGGWGRIARPRVHDGRYSARFKPEDSSRSRVKVVFGGDATNTGARRKRRLIVYRPEFATWYGPGLYGNRTACGRTLGYETLGVAHRSLPCGTKVGILYRGRTITVPVIDRGPYGSAEWDLTRGTAARLGFTGRGTVGTVH